MWLKNAQLSVLAILRVISTEEVKLTDFDQNEVWKKKTEETKCSSKCKAKFNSAHEWEYTHVNRPRISIMYSWRRWDYE